MVAVSPGLSWDTPPPLPAAAAAAAAAATIPSPPILHTNCCISRGKLKRYKRKFKDNKGFKANHALVPGVY